jgi:uncharacterized protein YidB (DUF937 family)
MTDSKTFRQWADDPARKPLAAALARLLMEENPDDGANDLVEELRRTGYGRQLERWLRSAKARRITPKDVRRVLGEETIDDLAVDAGLPLDETQQRLTSLLPEFVAHLAPDGEWDPAVAQDILSDYIKAAVP